MKKEFTFIVFFVLVIFSGCKKTANEVSKTNFGKLIFQFEHYEGGELLNFDTLQYTNAAGNKYEITEIQWFVSDITLVKNDGSEIALDTAEFAHYIDTNIPDTKTWIIEDSVATGNYKSIKITFGIKGEKNKPYMFTDPPESNMLWPINLGGEEGGYHYMKLNGFWINKNEERSPFNFHLGVGQERDNSGAITGFIQNWFEVSLPNSSFEMKSNDTLKVTVAMNVNKWFENPHIYDHNIHGGKIMQNQEAMNMGKENGAADVFSVVDIKPSTNK